MKLERAGKNIVMAEIFGTDVIPCDILTPIAIERIVQNNNLGEEVVGLYKEYRETCTVSDAIVFFYKIEQLFRQYQKALYLIEEEK